MNLPVQCDGYTTKFVISHTLSCKVGRLVKTRYDESKDTLGCMACNGFQQSNARDESLIYPHCVVDKLDASKDILDQGDLFAQGF